MTIGQDYRKKFDAQIEEWNAKLDQLEAKAKQAGADVRIEYKKRVADLRDKIEAAKARREELQQEGEDAWEGLKQDVDTAWKNVKDFFGANDD